MSIYRTKPVQDTFALGMIDPTTSLRLTSELVTQTIGIVAKKRTGKSYLAKRLTEGLMDMGQQVCVVDPKGDWWGLRSSADGKGEGYPIVIFGGEHGDVPLEAGGGEVVATFVVESGTCTLLDLSLLRKHEVATFMTAFLETLYRLKAREVNRTPMMLVVDEADAIAPQKPQPNEARMLGAMQDIVRRGGQRGVGCTMVTQRTAVLSKDVLTQVQILIALRTISPQDLKAMNEWIDVHGTTEQRKTLMASLPSLPIGEAWVWSPGWPTEEGIFDRIRTVKITTYDSGATPKPGERRVEPKVVSAVDLDKLRGHMAATIEQAKANDPKALRATIKALVNKLEEASKRSSGMTQKQVDDITRAAVEEAVLKAVKVRDAQWRTVISEQHGMLLEALRNSFGKTFPPNYVEQREEVHYHQEQQVVSPKIMQMINGDINMAKGVAKVGGKVVTLGGAGGGAGDARMTKSQRRVLTVLAQHRQIHGDSPLPKPSVAMRSGYSLSGSFDSLLSGLRTAGWLTQGEFRITSEGLMALGSYEVPPALGEELRAWWYGKITVSQRRVLTALEGGPLTKSLLARASGYNESGSFDSLLSSLRTLGLLVGGGREMMRMHEDIA